MSLSEHVYNCHACGARLNRDVNAAINLARWPDRNKNLLLLAVAV
jgi:transposase